MLDEREVTREIIDYVVGRIGEFDADNRAGLERTLHRISAIRNRRGHIVGLTCRVGRAVYGTIDIIQDLVESGKSILLLGRPGVGKTTMLREAARILAETKRVVIVDTSNEIGGDGDVPHPAVGRARRMQVRTPSLQHEVMIEAVENHNPEVIVIDEIGRELEAAAARTIAERGVQLIGTAHGNTIDNILLNPTLADLVGGIESVTLSDEEARRRGTQKTVLERRAPPTFDILVEIQDRERLAVHYDVAASVDAILRGRPLPPQLRYADEKGEVHKETAAPAPSAPGSRERPRKEPSSEASMPWNGAPRQYETGPSPEQPAVLADPAAYSALPLPADPGLSLRRRPQPPGAGGALSAGSGDGGERPGRGRSGGDDQIVLSPQGAVDRRRRTRRTADLCFAFQYRQPDGAIPFGIIRSWAYFGIRTIPWTAPCRRRRKRSTASSTESGRSI